VAENLPLPEEQHPQPRVEPREPVRITRRQLLVWLGIGGTAAALGGVGYRLLSWGPVGSGLRALTSTEVATVRALCETLLPGEGAVPPALEVDVPARFDQLVAEADREPARLVKLLLRAVEYGSLPAGRFSHLPLERRRAEVAAWEGSRFAFRRRALITLKLLLAMPYFEDERVRAGMGCRLGCGGTP
jgi:hypothetical protein